MADSGKKPLVITIVLAKVNDLTGGVILTVQNDADSITQTIVFDGTAITTTVKGSSNTSVITQKQDSVDINCKTFTIEAETITCKSTKDSQYHADGKMTVDSKGAMLVQSTTDAATFQANQKLAITSDTANIESTASAGDVKWSSMNLNGQASLGATIKANTQLQLQGTASASLKGAQVQLSGDAQIQLAGPITQVGGSGVTTIAGGILKLG